DTASGWRTCRDWWSHLPRRPADSTGSLARGASTASWAGCSRERLHANARRSLDIRPADIEVRDRAEPLRPVRRHPHARLRKLGRGCLSRSAVALQVDHDDVRLRVGGSDGGTAGQQLGEPLRVRVIFRNAIEIVIERIESGRGENPGLPHAAAQSFADFPRARAPVFAESQTLSDGAAQAF